MINRIVLIQLLHAPIYLHLNARKSTNVSAFYCRGVEHILFMRLKRQLFASTAAHAAAEGSQQTRLGSGKISHMCFSAKVTQSLKEYLRVTGAVADLAQIETVFERRLTDRSVRIARGFERNFDDPKSEQELRIRALLDRYRSASVTALEQEVFAQKKRLYHRNTF